MRIRELKRYKPAKAGLLAIQASSVTLVWFRLRGVYPGLRAGARRRNDKKRSTGFGIMLRSSSSVTLSLCPPARFSTVALYGPWFARPEKTPVTAHPRGLQGRFDLNGKYFLSGSYCYPQRRNFVAPRPWLIWASARLVNGQNPGDILRALATECVQNTRKNAFGPEKTRFKKALIISFIARINKKSACYYVMPPEIAPCEIFALA